MLNCDTTNAKTHVECIVIGYSFELIEEIEEMTNIASLLARPCSDPLHAPSAQSGLWAAIVLFISGSRHFYSYHHQIASVAATDN